MTPAEDKRAAREQELLALAAGAGSEDKARQLCEDLAFLEEQLQELKRLPFLRIDPKNPERQKATPAARQYKELLQQYNNGLKLLCKICGDFDDNAAEESPLRAWANARSNR